MRNNNSFNFTYTAPTEEERREIESIRRQYKNEPREERPTERLRRLHATVVNTARCAALVTGIIGTLVFGLGLTFILEWNKAVVGVIFGIVGAICAALAYPAYRFVLARGKAKYGDEILRLSEQLLGEDSQ